MTPIALLISLAGLSQREASEFLGVRIDTVQSWHRKSNPPTPRQGVIDELRALITRQEALADAALADIIMMTPMPDMIEMGFPTDDHEAQILGWPNIGAWAGMAARIVAASPIPVSLVTQG